MARNKQFDTFSAAYDWACKFAKDSCYAFQFWKVVHTDNGYAVAILSKNTRQHQGWAI